MPTHIDDIFSEVVTDSEAPSAEKSGAGSRWKDSERIRKTLERKQQIERRTKAEGFDD